VKIKTYAQCVFFFLISLFIISCSTVKLDKERSARIVEYAQTLVRGKSYHFHDQKDSLELSEAEDSLRLAVKLDPKNAEAQYWLGETIFKAHVGHLIDSSMNLKALKEGVKHIKRALEIQPQYTGSYNVLPPRDKLSSEWGTAALHFMIYGDIDKAKWAFQKAKDCGGYTDDVLEISRNFLICCPKDAVLYTSGDMDTYGMLYLQLMEGFRTDVKVLNLSLLNTAIYIKYSKKIGAPITMTQTEIDSLCPYYISDTVLLKIQDQVVKNIIENATIESEPDLKPPICFAIIAACHNKKNYGENWRLRGIVYELKNETFPHGTVNFPVTKDLLFNKMSYTTLIDSVYAEGNNLFDVLVFANYVNTFLVLAFAQKEEGDTAGIWETLDKARELLPYSWRIDAFTAYFAYEFEDTILADKMFQSLFEHQPNNCKAVLFFAHFAMENEYSQKSLQILHRGYAINPGNIDILKYLIAYYYHINDMEMVDKYCKEWVDRHPEEEHVKELQVFLERLKSNKDANLLTISTQSNTK